MSAAAPGAPRLSPAERKAQILDAATTLFEANGFDRTTTDEIAEAAGITKRTMYKHMANKEQILFEVHDRFMDEVVDAVTSQHGSVSEQLRVLIDAQMRVVGLRRNEIQIFFAEMKHLSADRRKTLTQRRDDFETMWRTLIASGVDEQLFAPGDVSLRVKAILGALNETAQWLDPEGRVSVAEISALLVAFTMNGIAARASDGHAKYSIVRRPLPPTVTADGLAVDAILLAGISLFSSRGYHRTSTRELADAAGITKGALFYHIGSKVSLLVRIHDAVLAAGIAAVSEVEGDTAADRLAQLIVIHCAVMERFQSALAVMTDERKYLPEEERGRLTEIRNRYEHHFQQAIIDGQASGEFVAGDPRVLTLVIVGMLNATYRWYRPGGRFSSLELGELLADTIIYGLHGPG